MINQLSSNWFLCLSLYLPIQPIHCFKLDTKFPSWLKFCCTLSHIPRFHPFQTTIFFVHKILIRNNNSMPFLMFFFLPDCSFPSPHLLGKIQVNSDKASDKTLPSLPHPSSTHQGGSCCFLCKPRVKPSTTELCAVSSSVHWAELLLMPAGPSSAATTPLIICQGMMNECFLCQSQIQCGARLTALKLGWRRPWWSSG